MTKPKKNWEEELQILGLMRFDTDEYRLYKMKELKQFISNLLSSQRKELRKEIGKLYDDKDTNDMTLDKVMEKL